MNDPSGFTEARSPRAIETSKRNPTTEAFDEDWNYEATVRRVEEIMARIEAGELELAEVFDEFTKAVEYLHQCETFLNQRQQQMDLLIETLTDNEAF